MREPSGALGRARRGAAFVGSLLVSGVLVGTLSEGVGHAQLATSQSGEAHAQRAHFVAIREAKRTVMYLGVTFDGKPSDEVALVVPVPANADAPRAMTATEVPIFARLDALTSPRLVEYWEQDPCEFHTGGPDDGVAERDINPAKPAPAPKAAGSSEVSVQTVADVAAAKSALEALSLTLPSESEALLEDYLSQGFRLAVVTGKPNADGSLAVRWVLPEGDVTVPTRLLALGDASPVPAVIDVLASDQRFEAKNRVNLAAPSNVDVKWGVKGSTEAFHGVVLGELFTAQPDAVVTEYAWRASSCAPCTGHPLDETSLIALGVSAIDQQEVMIFTEGNVSTKPDGPPALRQALAACYAKVLGANEGSRGEVTIDITLAGGQVSAATVKAGASADESLQTCATSAVQATAFDGSGTKGSVRAQFLPLSREFVSELVLTRLRAQASPQVTTDVVLRAGSPIAGGSEIGPAGKPVVGAYGAPKANHFQSRYTVRHAWAGAQPSCLNPEPGKWGAPPKGVTPKPPGKALVAPSAAQLSELLAGDLPKPSALTMRFAVPDAQPLSTAPPSPPPAASVAPVASNAPPTPIAPTPPLVPPHDRPEWVGYLAIGVCVAALYLSIRQQNA